MKIGVASDDQMTIARHFGRSKGFVIVDIAEGQLVDRGYRMNTFSHHQRPSEHTGSQEHGHSHGAILEALEDCQVVVARGMGRRIYEDLRTAGIEAMIVNEDSIEAVISALLDNQLVDHPEKGCVH